MWRKIIERTYDIKKYYKGETEKNGLPKLSERGSVVLTLDCGHLIKRCLSHRPGIYAKCPFCVDPGINK